ncbi:hypothetical protein R1flu_013099 [Riccia fluitans]|uniref:Uncharacterized protein n=1 Tax=Riccia fluitans TaxID=41844 RepID=A0ABD1ZGI8_9MARC
MDEARFPLDGDSKCRPSLGISAAATGHIEEASAVDRVIVSPGRSGFAGNKLLEQVDLVRASFTYGGSSLPHSVALMRIARATPVLHQHSLPRSLFPSQPKLSRSRAGFPFARDLGGCAKELNESAMKGNRTPLCKLSALVGVSSPQIALPFIPGGCLAFLR